MAPVFISRTAIPHRSVPTVRYYALARSHGNVSNTPSSWLAERLHWMTALWTWLGSTLSHSIFMFSQGWMTGVAIQHPVFAFPILTMVYGSTLHYFNLTFMDSVWWMGSVLVEALKYCIYGIQMLTGGPEPNTLIILLLMYGLVLCGLSTACGLGFVVWRSVVSIVQIMVYYGFSHPMKWLRSFDLNHRLQPLVDFPAPLPVLPPLSPLKTAASPSDPVITNYDSTSNPSSDASQSGSLPLPSDDQAVLTQVVSDLCQAHLIILDHADGLAVAPKPCHGKRVKPETILNMDCFSKGDADCYRLTDRSWLRCAESIGRCTLGEKLSSSVRPLIAWTPVF